MIPVRLVVDVLNRLLSKRLQLVESLTIQKAGIVVCNSEMVEKQHQLIHGSTRVNLIDYNSRSSRRTLNKRRNKWRGKSFSNKENGSGLSAVEQSNIRQLPCTTEEIRRVANLDIGLRIVRTVIILPMQLPR